MTDIMENDNLEESQIDDDNKDSGEEDFDDLEDNSSDTSFPAGKRISPIKAIRLKCVDCSGGSRHEVSLCSVEKCPLHPFRFGKNPFARKRVISEERKAEMIERLRLCREARSESGTDSA